MQGLVTNGVLGFTNLELFLSSRVGECVKTALAGVQQLESRVNKANDDVTRAGLFKSAAQSMLLLDRPEDAAEYFAECIKQVPRKCRDDFNATSCLFTGIQSLHRNHLRLAATCLQRALETKGTSIEIQIESSAVLATLFFRLGMRRPANMSIDHALRLLDGDDRAAPRAVLEVLRVEFLALNLIRQHPRLEDLAFWPRQEEAAGAHVGVDEVLRSIKECKAKAALSELLLARLDFLETLVKLAYCDAASMNTAMAHVEQMTSIGLVGYSHSARIELALAAIAAGKEGWVRQAMQAVVALRPVPACLHDNLEFDYCLAKLGEMQHRGDVYIKHYRLYTQAAIVQIRRSCAYIKIPHVLRPATQQIPKDDVATRLPGKYRRAYRFMLENLENAKLSVKMVADEIGVTERSLQLTFRTYLEQSPSEVIRRCRMQNIRSDLEAGATHGGSTLIDVASRWGVNSRSSLTHSYQREFAESPRQTLDECVEEFQ